MANNESYCTMDDTQMKITTILYTSFSLLSLLIGLIAVLLNRCYYCHYKNKLQIDPMEEIFMLVLIACCIFEFTDSFQWFALYDDSVGCEVLGAVREYAIISLLVILTCLGIHLLILMSSPKCLRVINEEKQRRYKILRQAYVIATFLVPAILAPWPFIGAKYGKDVHICWLHYSNSSCGAGDVSNILTRLFMWYVWAAFVWLFTVGVVITSLYRYCVHRQNSLTKWKPDANISTIISILIVFIIEVTSSVLLMWGWIKKQNSFPLAVLVSNFTPLMLIILFIILIIRQMKIIVSTWHKEAAVPISTNSVVSYNSNGEKKSTSSSTFFILPEDEWDNEIGVV